jgi:hypothetical protein
LLAEAKSDLFFPAKNPLGTSAAKVDRVDHEDQRIDSKTLNKNAAENLTMKKISNRLALFLYLSLLSFGGVAKAQDASLFDSINRSPVRSAPQKFSVTPSAPRLDTPTNKGNGASPRALLAPQRPHSGAGAGFDHASIGSVPSPFIESRKGAKGIRLDKSVMANQPSSARVAPQGWGAPEVHVQPRVMPVLPQTCGFLPKLGFYGRLIPGVGMEILSVNYDGVAYREGLEQGDIIVSINGLPIAYDFDYEYALVDAAVYHYGRVSLVVRNVRSQPGCRIHPPFVRVDTQLPMRHNHGYAHLHAYPAMHRASRTAYGSYPYSGSFYNTGGRYAENDPNGIVATRRPAMSR